MRLDALIRLLPADFEFVLADVGSAGGLKQRWRPARGIVSALLFEPRDEAGDARRAGRDTIYPIALGRAAGRATLNLTALVNMSSTLTPNAALLAGFRKKSEHARIVSTLEMPVDTLDAIVARDALVVDAIKVDTQGSELEILEGARRCLASVILAEVEVSFMERYQGQPLAGDIIGFMQGCGFDLLDLHRLKRYRAANRSGVGNIAFGLGQRAGRLSYGDALFFVGEQRLVERVRALPPDEGERLALKAMIALLVYGKPDIAARLFDGTADLFDAQRRAGVEAYLRRLGRRRWRSRALPLALDFLARHV